VQQSQQGQLLHMGVLEPSRCDRTWKGHTENECLEWLMKDCAIGPFLFNKASVTGNVYLGMTEFCYWQNPPWINISTWWCSPTLPQWIKHFQISGSEEEGPLSGHLGHQTSLY
jgi:hypothetical protein